MNDKTIGFIGTGLMGNPMAKHLINAGYTLPGLTLVKQLYLFIQAMGNGSSGNQALYLALEKLSNMAAR